MKAKPERNKEIFDHFVRGISIKRLADVYGVTATQIHRIVHRVAQLQGLKYIDRPKARVQKRIEVIHYGRDARGNTVRYGP